MKAILCQEWGGPSKLILGDVDLPPLQAGQVRLKIHACGINFADTLIIQGKYQERPPLPFTPGMEIAGEILECGPEVTHLKPGQRAVAICDNGGYAEEINIAADRVVPLPPTMDYVTAAAFPIAYGTSHLALVHRANLQAGETLLVLGASGGVGLTAVEIGKQLGATVIAAASSDEKLALTQQYGADHLINYSREDLRERVKEITRGKGANVIYDPVGGKAFESALRCISWEGRLLVIGFASGEIPSVPMNLPLVKNYSIVGLYWGAYAKKDPQTLNKSLSTLISWHKNGAIKPHISQTFPLTEAASALSIMINRQSTGKLVLVTARS